MCSYEILCESAHGPTDSGSNLRCNHALNNLKPFWSSRPARGWRRLGSPTTAVNRNTTVSDVPGRRIELRRCVAYIARRGHCAFQAVGGDRREICSGRGSFRDQHRLPDKESYPEASKRCQLPQALNGAHILIRNFHSYFVSHSRGADLLQTLAWFSLPTWQQLDDLRHLQGFSCFVISVCVRLTSSDN